jgi:hypothetical protein
MMVSVGIAGISFDAWSGAPQFPQNRVSEGLSKRQAGHFMTYESFLRFQSGQPFLSILNFGQAGVGILPESEDSAIVLDIFSLRKDLALSFWIPDGNLIGFPNRSFCVKTQELRHLLEEKVASFIVQHRLFACPEGYDDAFA